MWLTQIFVRTVSGLFLHQLAAVAKTTLTEIFKSSIDAVKSNNEANIGQQLMKYYFTQDKGSVIFSWHFMKFFHEIFYLHVYAFHDNLVNQTGAQTYLEPNRTSKIKLFAKLDNQMAGKNAPSQTLDWVLNTPLPLSRPTSIWAVTNQRGVFTIQPNT